MRQWPGRRGQERMKIATAGTSTTHRLRSIAAFSLIQMGELQVSTRCWQRHQHLKCTVHPASHHERKCMLNHPSTTLQDTHLRQKAHMRTAPGQRDNSTVCHLWLEQAFLNTISALVIDGTSTSAPISASITTRDFAMQCPRHQYFVRLSLIPLSRHTTHT